MENPNISGQKSPFLPGNPGNSAGSVLALLSATAFGVITTFAALAYQEGLTALTLTLVRAGLGALVAAIVAFCLGQAVRLPKDARPYAWGAGVMMAIQSGCYLASVAYIPVGLAVLLFYTFPLFIAAFERLFTGQHISTFRLAAFAVAFGGLAMALGPDLEDLGLYGLLLAAVGGIGNAGLFILSGRAMRDAPALTVTVHINLASIPVIGIALLVFGTWSLPTGFAGWWPFAVALGCYVAAVLSMYASIRRMGAGASAMLFNIEPLVSISAAAILLDERLTAQQWLGGLVVVAALAAGEFLRRREA